VPAEEAFDIPRTTSAIGFTNLELPTNPTDAGTTIHGFVTKI
jgi:hypothetical protein